MKQYLKRNSVGLMMFVAYLLIMGAIVAPFTGCKTANARLETGGPYALTNAAPDMPLFVADSAYQLAYTTIDAAFTVEKNNRDLLWKVSPEIKHTLDRIRPDADKARKDYLSARAVYIVNSVPANLSDVNAFLAKLQQFAIAAQAALPKK